MQTVNYIKVTLPRETLFVFVRAGREEDAKKHAQKLAKAHGGSTANARSWHPISGLRLIGRVYDGGARAERGLHAD